MAKKSPKWFVKVRGSYLPNSWQAWLLYMPFTFFLVASLVVAIRLDASVGRVIYTVFPQWVAAAVVMTWVAAQKS